MQIIFYNHKRLVILAQQSKWLARASFATMARHRILVINQYATLTRRLVKTLRYILY
jgi:hypothetical protein